MRRAHGGQGEDNSVFTLVDREVSGASGEVHGVAEAW